MFVSEWRLDFAWPSSATTTPSPARHPSMGRPPLFAIGATTPMEPFEQGFIRDGRRLIVLKVDAFSQEKDLLHLTAWHHMAPFLLPPPSPLHPTALTRPTLGGVGGPAAAVESRGRRRHLLHPRPAQGPLASRPQPPQLVQTSTKPQEGWETWLSPGSMASTWPTSGATRRDSAGTGAFAGLSPVDSASVPSCSLFVDEDSWALGQAHCERTRDQTRRIETWQRCPIIFGGTDSYHRTWTLRS